jgi:phage terminase large subunit-like protein
MHEDPHIKNLIQTPTDNRSVIQKLADSPPEVTEEFFETLKMKTGMDDEELAKKLKYMWELWARPNQLPPEPEDSWETWILLFGRGGGKGATLETGIPTPYGWTTMGEIKVGDKVFDESGNICNVTAVTDTYIPKKAFRLWFSDNSYLDVCDEHQWAVWNNNIVKSYDYIRSKNKSLPYMPNDWVNYDSKSFSSYYWSNTERKELERLRKLNISKKIIAKKFNRTINAIEQQFNKVRTLNPYIKTTEDIVNLLNKNIKLLIPISKALKIQTSKKLPMSPWALGYLLGDGSSKAGTVACHSNDKDFLIHKFKDLGFNVTKTRDPEHFYLKNIKKTWRKLNLENNKHIPQIYLRASLEDRIELIRGLIDSDGGVDHHGTFSFSNTNKKLIDGIKEVIISIGLLPRNYFRKGRLKKGKICKDSYVINVSSNIQLATLPYKMNRAKLDWKREQFVRYIVKYEEIKPIPMKCIQVNSVNSMYLIGKNMIPTHNTRAGAELVRKWAESGKVARIGLVGPTSSAVRDVMVTGRSGIMNICPNDNKPVYTPTNLKLEWRNGCIAQLFSVEEPERIRGANLDKAWSDELCSWRNGKYAWNMLSFALREGHHPQTVVTTTPKPVPVLLDLLKLSSTYTVKGSSYENVFLAKSFFEKLRAEHEGTRLGQQEIYAEILDTVPGALWNYENIEDNRVKFRDDGTPIIPQFKEVVLAIDPAGKSKGESAETGICIAALGVNNHFYILHLDSYKELPEQWARRAINLFKAYDCDKMVAEVNYGGDMVKAVIKSIDPFQLVYDVNASRNKIARAEPISALYEQNFVHHMDIFKKAEQQMVIFNPLEKPTGLVDCVDALVWSCLKLLDDIRISKSQGPMIGGIREKLKNYRYY